MLELKRAAVITINASVTYTDEQMEKILNALEQGWRNLPDDASYTRYKTLNQEECAHDFVLDVLYEIKLYEADCNCYENNGVKVDVEDLPRKMVTDIITLLFDKLCERVKKEREW